MSYTYFRLSRLCKLAAILNKSRRVPNSPILADLEENVEEMVGTTREAAGGDRVRRGRDRGTRQRRWLVTNETAATGGVMYTDEGELEFDEDEMAALDFEGFHASVPAGNLSGRNDSGSERVV